MKKIISYIIIVLLFLGFSAQAEEPFSWPVKELDTARELSWMNEQEKDMILELNKLRYNPSQYALQYIEWMRLYYTGKKLDLPSHPGIVHTEGIESFNELIAVLNNLPSLPVLIPSKGMTKAERILVYDQSLTGKTGHISSGNRKTEDRLSTFGNWYGTNGETLYYGEADAQTIVINMLFDNSRAKTRRVILLNPAYQYVGISIGHHKTYNQMCALSFCTKYAER